MESSRRICTSSCYTVLTCVLRGIMADHKSRKSARDSQKKSKKDRRGDRKRDRSGSRGSSSGSRSRSRSSSDKDRKRRKKDKKDKYNDKSSKNGSSKWDSKGGKGSPLKVPPQVPAHLAVPGAPLSGLGSGAPATSSSAPVVAGAGNAVLPPPPAPGNGAAVNGTTPAPPPVVPKLSNYIAPCYMQRPTQSEDEKKERILIVKGLQHVSKTDSGNPGESSVSKPSIPPQFPFLPCFPSFPRFPSLQRQMTSFFSPQGQTASQLLQYVNVFVLTVTQQTGNQASAALGPATANFRPAFDCEIDFGSATSAAQTSGFTGGRSVGRGMPAMATTPGGPGPVAKVYFRSFEGTQVALNLHGLEFEGSTLSVSRPEDFMTCKR